jgi:HSP20 family molecular chaperone IbpA
MICRRCGKEVNKGWRYCPNCGTVIEQRSRSIFDDIFSRFRSEFRDMDKLFDKEFEVLDLSPFFRARPQGTGRPRGTGFTIKITRRNNEQPRVDVKTFGNVDRNDVRKEVAEEMGSLGIRPGSPGTVQKERPPGPPEKPAQEPARFCEEPRTSVRSIGTKVMVDMELPDVKSESDIEISELQSSVEVRARAGDKAYFKIITKPERFSVTSRRFVKGRLHLEFS